MRETSPRGWHRWRVTVVTSATPAPALDLGARLRGLGAEAEPAHHPAEQVRGPDGIRHELVARVRQQIADGTYDTEEKWLAAEEALFRRIAGCA